MIRRIARLSMLAPVALLAACTEQDVTGVERAADAFFGEFFEFVFTMMVLSTMMTFAYVMLFAGMATAILAAVRANRDRREGRDPAGPGTDWLAIGFLVFGGIMLFATSPWVFGIGFSFHDEPGRSLTPFLPVILLGMGLAFAGSSRFRRRRREAAAAGQHRQQQSGPQAGWPPVPPPAPQQTPPPPAVPAAVAPRPAPKRRPAPSRAKPKPARAKPKSRSRSR